MSAPPRGRGGGGVLQINASATKKTQAAQGQARAAPRAPAQRLRLIVRRLPPGLTESEFWNTLGNDWHLGKGKIDWATYKDGKISKDPSKPSRPARVYLKVKDQSMLDSLSVQIKQTTFQDARNTAKDSCLVGPPSLEFAPYSKMQSGRVRHDGRQGTIDQDLEFIDFLQSLTEPITKGNANGVEADAVSEKVTTTPLVQYLKEKKANKAKEAAEKKSKAKQENKEAKPAKRESKSAVIVKGSSATAEKVRVAKATQDAVKAINKSVASMQSKQTPAKGDSQSSSKETPTQTSPPKRERERGNASAAARMLQRDLGLAPKSPRAARPTPVSPAATKTEPSNPGKSSIPSSETKATSTAPSTTSTTPPTGPRASRAPLPTSTATSTTSTPTTPKPTPSQRPSKPLPNPSPSSKSAFLKHANPSQGVTEDLLRTAFAAFGNVTRCEIDKKKGLGYVDFEDSESLRKAMHASPVKVGNGQVVVLENRNPNKGKGQAALAKGATPSATSKAENASATASPAVPASATTSPAPVSATPTSQQPNTTTPSSPATTASAPAAATAPTTSAPTAPRASSRGNPRGGRGGTPAAPRGNLGAAARGGARGGLRGARGGGLGFAGRGRGGNANAISNANTTTSTSAVDKTTNTPTSAAGGNTSGETGGASEGGGDSK